MVFYLSGRILLVVACLMFLPFIVGCLYRESFQILLSWAESIGITLIFGAVLSFRRPQNSRIYVREGIVITSLSWLFITFFGAVPFVLSGAIPSLVDAFFESASGFTTTGSSILNNVEALPHSVLFWRSFTHFVGGMGVLVFALAIMPGTSGESIHLMKAEMPGPTFDKVVSRIREVARVFYLIYAVLTAVVVICLLLAGMSLFDALIHAFGTAGTGGFSNYNDSVGHFHSSAIEWIIGIGMLIFGINFNLYFFLLHGHWKNILKSEELHWFLGIVSIAVFALVISVQGAFHSLGECFREAFFTVSTIITTTGYGTVDFTKWPLFSQIIILMLMFIGGCAGSTAGGLKISRITCMAKMLLMKLRLAANPKRVTIPVFEKKPISRELQNDIGLYFILYCATFTILVLMISFENKDFTTTFSSVAATFNNIGPGLAEVGPKGNFSDFSNFSKVTLAFGMLAGRLELLPLILLFSPSTWRV